MLSSSWVKVLALLLTRAMNLGKLLNIFELQLSFFDSNTEITPA